MVCYLKCDPDDIFVIVISRSFLLVGLIRFVMILLLSLVTVYTVTFSGIIAIPVIFQVASLLAALAHPGHIVCYAPGDSLPCRRDAS
ncbi:hypothetical protein C6H65_05985 [Photorhabdus luminescens]|nr:hypothetical protein C6H65_05985 [Photorhabdus luminescens]